jgi:hypothetical protein
VTNVGATAKIGGTTASTVVSGAASGVTALQPASTNGWVVSSHAGFLSGNAVNGTDPVGTTVANGLVTTVGSSTPWTGLGYQTAGNVQAAIAPVGLLASNAVANSGGTATNLTLGSNLNAGGYAITNTAPCMAWFNLPTNSAVYTYSLTLAQGWLNITNMGGQSYTSGGASITTGAVTVARAGVYRICSIMTKKYNTSSGGGIGIFLNGSTLLATEYGTFTAASMYALPVECVTNLPANSVISFKIQSSSTVTMNPLWWQFSVTPIN